MQNTSEVGRARAIAERAHRGQVDKVGDPYIGHPAMVATLVRHVPGFESLDDQTQADAVVAAWLHDVIEDTGESADSLRSAGVSDRAVDAVVALTRRDDVPSDAYYAGVAANPIARMVKTADIASNLAPERVRRLDPSTRDRLAVKYDHALKALGVDPDVIAGVHDTAQPTRSR